MNTRQKVILERRRNPDVSAAEIARKIGVSRERVRQILKSEGLATAVVPNWPVSEKQELMDKIDRILAAVSK